MPPSGLSPLGPGAGAFPPRTRPARGRVGTQGVSSLSTAILTGQPVPGSSLESDLRSLGFDVRLADEAGDAETLLAAVPADQRVAVVDARFVGHLHALRLGLTDPRFAASAVPGAVTVQPAARQALTRALARENSAAIGSVPARPPAASEQTDAATLTGSLTARIT